MKQGVEERVTKMAKMVTELVWNGNGRDEVTISIDRAYDKFDAWCPCCETVFRKGSGYEIDDKCPYCDDAWLQMYEVNQN